MVEIRQVVGVQVVYWRDSLEDFSTVHHCWEGSEQGDEGPGEQYQAHQEGHYVGRTAVDG